MTFPPQPPREADWSTWGTFLHNTASASWPIWPSGGDDSVSIRTALAGGARTILLLPGQTYSFTTSIGEDMVDINQSLTIIAWGATCLITGAGLATTPQFTPDPTVKWLFFPNTASASVNGKTSVTVDTTTRTTLTGGASGASSHRLRIFGGHVGRSRRECWPGVRQHRSHTFRRHGAERAAGRHFVVRLSGRQ
jgi:hypothetical protein